MYVRVHNQTDETIPGRYDGEDYEFPARGSMDVPKVVAAHVFGLGAKDKSACLARLGWLTTSDQMKVALAKLNQIRFEEIELVGRVIEEDDGATSQQIAPARIGAASPRVSPDGDTGASLALAPAEPTESDADTI